jgi:hypothetical protein
MTDPAQRPQNRRRQANHNRSDLTAPSGRRAAQRGHQRLPQGSTGAEPVTREAEERGQLTGHIQAPTGELFRLTVRRVHTNGRLLYRRVYVDR